MRPCQLTVSVKALLRFFQGTGKALLTGTDGEHAVVAYENRERSLALFILHRRGRSHRKSRGLHTSGTAILKLYSGFIKDLLRLC